tara:strand:+ start:109 stop:357 length:249 start_codon:yes stop_codon:yes gene_type:complete
MIIIICLVGVSSGGAGLNITFLKHFYIQADYKIGYNNMPDIKTSLSVVDSVSQSFYFFQNNILIVVSFGCFKESHNERRSVF